MKRQTNTYSKPNDGKITLTIGAKTPVSAVFPAQELKELRLYKWSYRGKSGIFNELGVSLGAYLATIYGYSGRNWRRSDPNSNDYTPENYTTPLAAAGMAVKNWRPIGADDRYKGGYVTQQQNYYPPYKYRSKSECMEFEVGVYKYKQKVGVVTLIANTYLARHIPREARMGDNCFMLLDGTTRLQSHLANAAEITDSEDDVVLRSMVARYNMLDFRVADGQFVSTVHAHRRWHRCEVEGVECIVMEHIETKKEIQEYMLRDPTIPFITEGANRRHTYLLIERKYIEKLRDINPDLNIFYHHGKHEFYITEYIYENGVKVRKPRLVKRAILEASGVQTEGIYTPPRMTVAYEKALNAATSSESFGTADRRRAKFENSADGMFTKPKYIERKVVVAEKNIFVGALYGGVGMWCKDMRSESIRFKTENK